MPHKRVLGQADWALARHPQSTGKEISCRSTRRRGGCRACCHSSFTLARKRMRHPHAPLGIKTEHAFADCALRKSTTREALALRSASRHPGRSTLPREPCSLRRASGFSHEYLLLSPRSALAHVPARTAPGLRHFSPKRVCATSAYAREVSSNSIPPAARHRPLAKRPPFSRPIHSASQLLRTA